VVREERPPQMLVGPPHDRWWFQKNHILVPPSTLTFGRSEGAQISFPVIDFGRDDLIHPKAPILYYKMTKHHVKFYSPITTYF